jgi:hypothetical protein
MIFPLMGYPLHSTTFTKAKSELITKTLYAQLLPSGGANQNYSTVYCHASSMFYGLALPTVIKIQFTKQVKKILMVLFPPQLESTSRSHLSQHNWKLVLVPLSWRQALMIMAVN